VTLDVELSEAYRALPLASRAPERCRIVFQRASEALWQLTAHDEQGTVYCDATSNGNWIEVEGKCWHPGYNEFLCDDEDANSEADPMREEVREARASELRERLWALTIARSHLWLEPGFLTDRYAPTWEFSRLSEGETVVGRMRMDYQPSEFRFSFFELLRWRIARLIRPGVEIEEYYNRKSFPTRQIDVVLNERCGFAPERFHLGDVQETSSLPLNGEVWEDPIPVGDGLFMPRIHKVLQTPSGDEVLKRSTLIPEESAFGVNIPLNIRPVDRTLERVDWQSDAGNRPARLQMSRSHFLKLP
jgi:hypothetical protein